jgi:molybdate transport system substrate-binding protein
MRRIRVLGYLVSTVLVVGLMSGTACSSKSTQPSPSAPVAGKVIVFAAASLKPAFTQIGQQFKTDNSGSSIDFDFAGSSELATQLTQGATADVFASADTAQMDKVGNAGLLAGVPSNFASNTLVIVTAPGNPKKIATFADLTRPGLNVVICQKPVPCGSATQHIEDSSGVHLSPVSEELSVTDVLNKVTTGQADAGLVYVTDAKSAGDKVTTVSVPEADATINIYPIAALKNAPQPTLADKFVSLVTSDTGQKILAQFGFAKP